MPPTTTPTFLGGSFSLPLSDETLDAYRTLAAEADEQTAGAMLLLLKMVDLHRAGKPASKGAKAAAVPHPSGGGMIVALPPAEVKRLWDAVPWQEEIDLYTALFDRIDPATHKPLRDAAFHLAWFARELYLDRQPMTADLI